MRSFLGLLVLFVIVFLLDFFTHRALRNSFVAWGFQAKTIKYLLIAFWSISVLYVLFIVYLGINRDQIKVDHNMHLFYTAFGLFVLIYVPKIVILVFQLFDDAGQFLVWSHAKVFRANDLSYSETRRAFFSQVGVFLSLLPFVSVFYGIVFGKFNYKLIKQAVKHPNLPSALNGLRVVQISDAHLGSFSKLHKPVLEALESINALKPDIVVFTGDLVNNEAIEAEMWIEAFSKVKARYGKFSILGNHDYGDYVSWNSDEEKMLNLEKLKGIHQQMGFRLLLNETVTLQHNNAKLNLIGVENWGKPPFPQHGDLSKATENTDKEVFNILLSHDPSHWDLVVRKESNIELTLSGHTHGMQFGIEIPGWIKWSPIKYRYPRWGGLYTEENQHLYVNRGFGVLGFPGRIGMPPEITVLELEKA